jgi:hypothetical protein
MSRAHTPDDFKIDDEGSSSSIAPNISINKQQLGTRFSKTVWKPDHYDEDIDDMDIPDEMSNCKLNRSLPKYQHLKYTAIPIIRPFSAYQPPF